MITKQQYTQLSKFELHLKRAYYGKYTMALTTREGNDLYDLYSEISGSKKTYTACPTCNLNVLTYLAEKYYSYKDGISELPAEKETKNKIIKKLTKKWEHQKEKELH